MKSKQSKWKISIIGLLHLFSNVLHHFLLALLFSLNLRDLCLQRFAVDCNSIEIVSSRMLFPIAKVPAQLCLSRDVHSSLVEFGHDLPEVVDSHRLCHPIAEVGVGRETSKEDLEQVSPHARIIGAGVLFRQLQVLKGEAVQVHDLPAEKSRVFQQGLSAHDSVDVGLSQALVYIIEEIDASVGNDWNVERLLDLFDYCPVTLSDFILVLFLGPAVHSEQLATSLLYSPCQLYGLLFGLHSSDFAEDGNLDVLSQSSDNPLDQLRLFQQKRAVVSFPCNALRTSQIDIDGIDLILKHLGCLHHYLWIISANLSDNWPILRTRGEVYTLVSLGRGHHLGMKHRRVCEVDSVFAREHAEGELGLIDHRAADQCGILEKGKFVVVVLHVKEILLLGIQIRIQVSLFGVEVGKGTLRRRLDDGFWVVGKVQLVLLEDVRHFFYLQVDVFA